MRMTKTQVKAALGVETDAELAKIFDIGRWAVGQWSPDKPIPEGRQWQLCKLYPDQIPLPTQEAA